MGLEIRPRKNRFQKDRKRKYRKVTSPQPFSTWRSKGVSPDPTWSDKN